MTTGRAGSFPLIELTAVEIVRFTEQIPTPTAAGCRIWAGELNNKGYGRFAIWRPHRTRRLLAHRVNYYLTTDQDIAGLRLLHSCDTPACVEVSHLRTGTQADNTRDAISRGRAVFPPHKFGEDHGHAKLTWEQVRFIRANSGSATHREIADCFGVSPSAIGLILAGKTWRSDPLAPSQITAGAA